MRIKFLALALSACVLAPPVMAAVTPPPPATITPQQTPQINLNTADVNVLSKSIKGIGVKRAEEIIKYRESHGNFKSIDDLSQVPGLGKNFVNTHNEQLQKVFILK